MCGISGIVGRQGNGNGARIAQLTRELHHRGPDAEAVWSDDFVQLGHNRLAIIDLDPSANQPFTDHETGIVIVYNGEVYNYVELREQLIRLGHTFRTKCDTEVVVKAYRQWGRRAFEHFVGMWAFALYDPSKRELVLCRDRFGIKPLYYGITASGLVFASELKAFARSGAIAPRAHMPTVARYLALGTTENSDDTFFEGVRSVPIGSYCIISVDDPRPEPQFQYYWRAEDHAASTVGGSYDDAVIRFATLFRDSVRLHLRSDVPIAMALSGGIDSSAIAGACASELGTNAPHAFCAVFPQTAFDESPYVRDVIDKWKLRATLLTPDASEFASDIDRVIAAQDQPFGSTGIYLQWKVFQAIGGAGYKVALEGQGADEYLAGYLTFLPPFLRSGGVMERARRVATNAVPIVNANLGALKYRFGSLPGIVRASVRHKRGDVLQSFTNEAVQELAVVPARGSPSIAGASPLKQALVHYLTRNSLPSLLRFGDRNSMHFSVESRVPFLDHRLVECALSLPDNALIRRGRTKAILRDAAADYLPESVQRRTLKLGFASPQYDWTQQVVLPRVLESIDSPAVSKYFAPDILRDEVRAASEGGPNARAQYWFRIYNLIRWHELFSVA